MSSFSQHTLEFWIRDQRMPRRSRRLNPPCHLDGLGDDLVLRLFSRAPFMTHGTLHVVCRRLKTLLRSPEFLQQRVDSGLVEHGLVAAGGAAGGAPTAQCDMLSSGRWRPITPLNGTRAFACSAIMEDEDGQPEMGVMGGDDGGKWLATVEAYNPRTNTCRSCLPLSQRRAGAVAGVVGGRLVVAGGWAGGGDRLTSVEAYTPTGWTPLPPLPYATTNATACVLNGRLYVMGGCDCDRLQVLEYSEENGFSWSVKGDLPWVKPCIERYSAGSAVVDGKLWLVGGLVTEEDEGIGQEPTASVSIYDPSLDSWAAGPPLPRPLPFFVSARAAVYGGGVVGRDPRDERLRTLGRHSGILVMSDSESYAYRGGAWRLAYVPSVENHAFQFLLLG